ncbi:L,D-transpeptidase family protein [Hyphomicrobium sp. LHD-15]|uniref:L,D-transpeptidase family protein n=1 Tax=Hyphomicrobium sp. LHD-15 TaxID=3072142 RepID=UPI00280CBB92|nr:L,D-transpeptidase family protein [Hyphomicrobium sp. LHD-15]MDQ8700080.1 L,D-transpeptidase family protein [Hyphomicrobium sp. LHD-15]
MTPLMLFRQRRDARSLGLVVFALAAIWSGSSAAAQDGAWWEGITSFGSPDYSGKRSQAERTPPRQDTLNDLRPNEVPWRSDEMLVAMEKAIDLYQGIVSKGGWPAIPGNRMMRPGDDDERVSALRRRLMATGELARSSSYNDYSFDSDVEQAVVRFQERNGLRANGRVDQPTLAALNITAEERLSQLKLNHGRILELVQTPPEERYVLVNVPAFQLEAVERYQTVLRHRVIVGRNGRETPTLKATIRNLNFFPYWRVPDSVAQLDVFPRLVKEPDYLAKEHIRVISGDFNGPELDPTSIDWSQADAKRIKLKQDPGPQNALGLVRIDMANEHGVYMHDTPMKPLFQQRARAFSAGCVRVQDVFELVEWLARFEPGWEQPGRAQAVLDQGMALDVPLSRPIPVYFAYITAWAEPDGRIEFRPDIYRRDGAVAMADVFDPDAPPPPSQGLAP